MCYNNGDSGDSFYQPSKKGTAHKTYKSLGSVETCRKNGIPDPVSYYQKEVDSLNQQRKSKGVPKISDISPQRFLGYFPLKSVMEKLHIRHYVDYFKITNDFGFDLYELLSSFIYARAVNPCSKYRTFHEVLPCLFENTSFSYGQLLDGLSFIGNDYEKRP